MICPRSAPTEIRAIGASASSANLAVDPSKYDIIILK